MGGLYIAIRDGIMQYRYVAEPPNNVPGLGRMPTMLAMYAQMLIYVGDDGVVMTLKDREGRTGIMEVTQPMPPTSGRPHG